MLLRTLVCFAIVCIAKVNFAGVITQFSNRVSFEAAIGAVTVENFTDTFHFPISTVDSFGLQAGILNSNTNLAVANGPPFSQATSKQASLTQQNGAPATSLILIPAAALSAAFSIVFDLAVRL